MSTMAEVIAAHINVYDDCKDETNVAVCGCGHETPFSGPYDPDAGDRAHAEHVAAELAAAGYGNKADAWDDQHEREITDLIKERDYLQAMCDRLAACIAPDDVLGEHSNMNDPWANALEYYASRQCRPAHPYGDSDNGPLNPIFSLGKVEDKRQPLPRGAGHE